VAKQTFALGAATGETRDASPDDPLFVPVTNANYQPSGGGELQGFVPDTPGDDKVLLRQKESLEAQGFPSGEDVEPIDEEDVGDYLGIPPADSTEEVPPDSEGPPVEPPVDPITDSPPPADTSSDQPSDKPLF